MLYSTRVMYSGSHSWPPLDLMPIFDVRVAFHFTKTLLLYPCAGSPSITSLTFDDQFRTLTCTSTGGPATTVSWRRDGVVITLNATYQQQTKRIVDPINGTYQTVLTIDPSVDHMVGTYTCTVENIRGESSETVVVPGETRTLYPNI